MQKAKWEATFWIILALAALQGAETVADEACQAQSQSYSRCRLLASEGRLVPAAEIRVDEWINYMDYIFPPLGITPKGEREIGFWAAMRVRPDEPDWSALLMAVVKTAAYTCERDQPVDLVIVLDRSGSMASARKMEYALEGIRKLVTFLRKGDRVGLIGFDTALFKERDLAPWKAGDSLDAELSRLTPAGGTDLELGLRAGMEMLLKAPPTHDPQGSPVRARRLMVLTDACTNSGEVNVENIVRALTPGFDAGIRLSCIGVGLEYNDALFSRLCRIPGNNGRFLDRPEEIGKSMVRLWDALVPLELDKPVLELDLPAGVRIESAYGTAFVQTDGKVSFPKLTSMGSDDHQVICLKLRGAPKVLQALAGKELRLNAESATRHQPLALRTTVQNLDEPKTVKEHEGELLCNALGKACVVAETAEALRGAAEAAEAKDWTKAQRMVRLAETTLETFPDKQAEVEIRQLRELVAVDRQIIEEVGKASGP